MDVKYVQIRGVKSTDLGLRIIGYSRPPYAEVRDLYTTIEGKEGSQLQPQPHGMYNFSVTFRCHFKDEAERIAKLEDISNFLYTKDLVEIVQSDLKDRYRIGKVVGTADYNPTFTSMNIDVEFTTNPYSYSFSETEISNEYTEDSTNFDVTIDELGSIFSEFELLVEIKSDVPQITIGTQDAELLIEYNFNAGDLIRVNTDNFTVERIVMQGDQVTSVHSLILDVYGEFPTLDKSNNKLTIGSNIPFTCNTDLKYRKRYLL